MSEPLTKSQMLTRLRDFRNSLGLVEVKLWVTPAKKEQLERLYPKPTITEEFKRSWKNGDH
jgi:hypothetical protein